MGNTRKRWSPDEDSLLAQLYPTMPADDLAEFFGVSYTAIKSRVSRLGIKKEIQFYGNTARHVWSDEDVAFLSENYPRFGADYCAQKLGVKVESVRSKASKMKIHVDPDVAKKLVSDGASAYMKKHNPMFKAENRMKASVRGQQFKSRLHRAKGKATHMSLNPTHVEKFVFYVLSTLKKTFQFQRVITVEESIYIVDFYLPQYNLVLEVDGKHWHSSPEQKERDAAKDRSLQSAGFNVIRVWERDVSINRIDELLCQIQKQ